MHHLPSALLAFANATVSALTDRGMLRPSGLEEGANRLALDAEADHAAGAVDTLDRLGRNEPAAGEDAVGTDDGEEGVLPGTVLEDPVVTPLRSRHHGKHELKHRH